MFIRSSAVEDQVDDYNPSSYGSGGNEVLKMTWLEIDFKISQNEVAPPVFETKPIENSSDIFYETPFTFDINQPSGIHLKETYRINKQIQHLP